MSPLSVDLIKNSFFTFFVKKGAATLADFKKKNNLSTNNGDRAKTFNYNGYQYILEKVGVGTRI